MGSALSLIHLPAQSGKTRKMTELINRWTQLFGLTGNSNIQNDINIIFTSNTKLLTKQTAGRIHSDVDCVSVLSDLTIDEDLDDDESISISMDIRERESKTIAWISSAKKVSVNDVFAKVTSDDDDEINNIICCTNKSRMKNVWELLTKLNKKFIKGNLKKKVNIWIDEADACINIWDDYMQQCEALIESKFIQHIVLVTATMVPVYNHLHSLNIDTNLRTYENTHSPVYHKYSESIRCHEFSNAKNTKTASMHLSSVLEHNPEIISCGTRMFCPGNKSKKSHEDMCDELLKNGFNVLLLNGSNKEIRFHDSSEVIEIAEFLETDLEVSKTLNKLYHQYELFNSPFAVTGNLCVSRGITFASQIEGKEFIFTHGIIPDVANGDEGYQMVARCCGNIKHFASYRVPKIFVSEKTDALIRQQENLAVEFAQKYFQGEVESMVKVTPGMLKDAIGTDSETDKKNKKKEEKDANARFIMGSMDEFASLSEANVFCKHIKKGAREEKETKFKQNNEFVCATSKEKQRFTYDEFMAKAGSWNAQSLMNMTDMLAGEVSKVIKPVYRGDNVVWLVKWAISVDKVGDCVDIPLELRGSPDLLANAIRTKSHKIVPDPIKKFHFKIIRND
jgi:hypothetical protein